MAKRVINKSLFKEAKGFQKIYGELKQDHYELCLDSRKLIEGQAFFALKGENIDAAQFIPQVISKSPLIITEDQSLAQELTNENTAFVVCKNSLEYLQALAALHLIHWRNHKKKVIGITGSNGKTTTKEMLFHLMEGSFPGQVVATEGNLNNHVGLPLTLLSAQAKHNILIVEMGTNHPGEIRFLCELAQPNAGIITSIGSAHMEFFKSEENVFMEKKNLFDFVRENTADSGAFVVCRDDAYLARIPNFPGLVSFGEKAGDINISLGTGYIKVGREILQNQNILGIHNFKNLAAAYLLACALFPQEKEKFLDLVQSFKPLNNRSLLIEKSGKKIFLDAYNANPTSMKASLHGFMDYLRQNQVDFSQCLFVLGDMNELGENSAHWHGEIGQMLKKIGAVHVVFIGKFSSHYAQGFGGGAKIFNDKKNFEPEWIKIYRDFNFFFIKASRSLQLESLLDIN